MSMNDPNGAHFEIIVDCKPRSYRDVKAVAVEAAIFLKEQKPTTEVSVRDLRDESGIDVGWGICQGIRAPTEHVWPAEGERENRCRRRKTIGAK